MAKRKKGLPGLKSEATKLFQKWVRLNAADDEGFCYCVSCGNRKHWSEMDGGHYIPRSSTMWVLSEKNVHPQCRHCNRFAMQYKAAAQAYTLFMIDTYGREQVDYMIATQKRPVKLFRSDLEEFIEDLKPKVQRLEIAHKGT